jgi:hypothetical protein
MSEGPASPPPVPATAPQIARPPPDGHPLDGAKIDELIVRTQQFVVRTLEQLVKEPVGGIGRWAGRKILLFSLGLVCLVIAAGFLLFGFMMMLAQWIPMFGACLLVGGAAVVLGVGLLIWGKG